MIQNNYAGNALGFKVSFLCKLMDTRSKTPRMTLLHYILDMACNLDPNILEFPRELSALRSVQKISMDSLNMEANEMHKNVEQLEEDVKNSNAEIKGKFLDFITFTKKKVKDLRADMENAQGMVKKLAGRYCEDEAKFNLQEFFLMFNNFCDKVEQAKKDNNQRKVNAENEIKRRARQPNFVASGGRSSLQVHEAENENMVEKLLAEIRKGEFKLHKRDSNNNGRCSVASTCSSVTDMAYNGEREPA
ncbi:protein diaphanous homolog 1-like [Gordionus sp. m RMFG-2023]|uniref:protein diaphanous homolog 1-like n=1 Tax=Gordionus sp. m RMFG-2023 TaxID=3053472 RepID=UPI0031FBF300